MIAGSLKFSNVSQIINSRNEETIGGSNHRASLMDQLYLIIEHPELMGYVLENPKIVFPSRLRTILPLDYQSMSLCHSLFLTG